MGKVCEFVRDYLNGSGATTNEFKDPSGLQYLVWFTGIQDGGEVSERIWGQNVFDGNSTNGYNLTFVNKGLIVVVIGAKCDGENIVKASNKDYAIAFKLEGSGVYCSDNS